MEAYPLAWSVGYVRTKDTSKSRFKTTLAKARDYVVKEVDTITGAYKAKLVISTNLPVNKNGELRADYERFKVADQGVAIYFIREKQNISLCRDKYDKIRDNLYAIGRTLEALRQIHRDGVSDFLNRTFSGFAALPAPGETAVEIWPVLEFTRQPVDVNEVHQAYKRLLKKHHPDAFTGSDEAFHTLQKAYKQALTYFS